MAFWKQDNYSDGGRVFWDVLSGLPVSATHGYTINMRHALTVGTMYTLYASSSQWGFVRVHGCNAGVERRADVPFRVQHELRRCTSRRIHMMEVSNSSLSMMCALVRAKQQRKRVICVKDAARFEGEATVS